MTSNRRIAIFHSSLEIGGVERVFLGLGKSFRDLGYEVDLLLMRRKGPLLSLVPQGIHIVDLGVGSSPSLYDSWRLTRICGLQRLAPLFLTRSFRHLSAIPALVSYLDEEAPAVLLSSMPKLNLTAILAARASGWSGRVIVREAIDVGRDIESARGTHKYLLRAARSRYREADGIIALSSGMADGIIDLTKVARDKIYTINNPVNVSDIQRLSKAQVDEGWANTCATPTIVALGRLEPQKDFETLVRAFARVRSERSVKMAIFGNGSQRASLLALIKEHGLQDDIALPGVVSNPFKYIAKGSVFVLSSAWEGFPNVLLEALACGCPIVSTDCPTGPREILADGKYGALVPVGDDRSMAFGIMNALDYPSDAASLKSRAAEYSLERIAQEYLNCLLGRASAVPDTLQ